MDVIKARKYPEVWPFIPGSTNVAIDEDKMYAFFDSGGVLGDVYDPALSVSQNQEKFKRVLAEEYGVDDFSTTPEELGWKTVVMTGRQFIDQVYQIDSTNEYFILTVGRWSNMTEEEASTLLDEYYDGVFGISQE